MRNSQLRSYYCFLLISNNLLFYTYTCKPRHREDCSCKVLRNLVAHLQTTAGRCSQHNSSKITYDSNITYLRCQNKGRSQYYCQILQLCMEIFSSRHTYIYIQTFINVEAIETLLTDVMIKEVKGKMHPCTGTEVR